MRRRLWVAAPLFAAGALAFGADCDKPSAPPAAPEAEAPPPAAEPDAASQIPVLDTLPEQPPPPSYGAADAGDFEGEIDFKIGPNPPATIQYFVKGRRSLLVLILGKQKLRWLVLPEEGKGYEVADLAKEYIVLPLAPAIDTAGKVVHTGTLQKIAGASCEEWEYTRGRMHSTGCILSGLGPFHMGRMLPASETWRAVLAGQGYFPLRIVAADEAGKETQRIEATRVQRQKLADTVFTVPAGFKEAIPADAAEDLDGSPFLKPDAF